MRQSSGRQSVMLLFGFSSKEIAKKSLFFPIIYLAAPTTETAKNAKSRILMRLTDTEKYHLIPSSRYRVMPGEDGNERERKLQSSSARAAIFPAVECLMGEARATRYLRINNSVSYDARAQFIVFNQNNERAWTEARMQSERGLNETPFRSHRSSERKRTKRRRLRSRSR